MEFVIYCYEDKKGAEYGWELLNSKGKAVAQCVDLYPSRPKCEQACKNVRSATGKDTPIRDRTPEEYKRNCLT